MSRKAMLLVAAVAAALVLGTPVALAGGNGATTFTQTDHNATDTFVDVVPCTGAPATINLTYNDVSTARSTKPGRGSWER
jgi:hypothetical protein